MRFLENHWGDLIGLLLLYTGVGLVLISATHLGSAQPVSHLGESLVLAGMGVLRLRGKNDRTEDQIPQDGPATQRRATVAKRAGAPGNI